MQLVFWLLAVVAFSQRLRGPRRMYKRTNMLTKIDREEDRLIGRLQYLAMRRAEIEGDEYAVGEDWDDAEEMDFYDDDVASPKADSDSEEMLGASDTLHAIWEVLSNSEAALGAIDSDEIYVGDSDDEEEEVGDDELEEAVGQLMKLQAILDLFSDSDDVEVEVADSPDYEEYGLGGEEEEEEEEEEDTDETEVQADSEDEEDDDEQEGDEDDDEQEDNEQPDDEQVDEDEEPETNVEKAASVSDGSGVVEEDEDDQTTMDDEDDGFNNAAEELNNAFNPEDSSKETDTADMLDQGDPLEEDEEMEELNDTPQFGDEEPSVAVGDVVQGLDDEFPVEEDN